LFQPIEKAEQSKETEERPEGIDEEEGESVHQDL